MSDDLEVRELRYFVAVAEELHFGRAAARLGIAQPPLSRAVREMERRLGVPLLARTTRLVTLTAAGEVLLRDARGVLEAVSAAGRRARHAGRSVPALRLAMKADYDGGLLPRILDVYQRDGAAVEVQLVLGGRGDQALALRDGRADVALVGGPPFDGRGLDADELLTEPRLVALAAADPLAAQTSLRLTDLAGRVLPDGTPADHGGAGPAPSGPAPSGAAPSGPAPSGATPLTVGNAGAAAGGSATGLRDLAQIFTLVELGTIVWFPPASIVLRHPRPGIAYRPVDDLAPSTLHVAWPRDARSPAVAAFVRAATAVSPAAPAPTPSNATAATSVASPAVAPSGSTAIRN